MIMALEAADSWRLTCSECTPDLQGQRGCKKPGVNMPLSGHPFRFDSPHLQPATGDKRPGLSILYECPTGMVLREAPWIYDVLGAVARDDNLSPSDRDRMSAYYHDAARLYRSERDRLRQRAEIKQQAHRDAATASRVLRQRAAR